MHGMFLIYILFKKKKKIAMILIGKDVKTKPYIPFVLGSMKSEINYGEKHYLWKNADSLASKQHFSNYLYRLLGNKTTYHF
jgi:hypothetical protein